MRTLYRLRLVPEPVGRYDSPWVYGMDSFFSPGDEFYARLKAQPVQDGTNVHYFGAAPDGNVRYVVVGNDSDIDGFILPANAVEVIYSAVEFEGSGDHVQLGYAFEENGL